MDHKAELISILGAAADATDEAIANSITAFRSDLQKFKGDTEATIGRLENSLIEKDGVITGLKAEKETLTNSLAKSTEELVNRDLETYKDVIKDVPGVKAQLLTNRDTTIGFLNGLKTPAAPAPAAPAAPLHNSRVQHQPAPVVKTGSNKGTPEQVARTSKIANRTAELQKSLGLSYQQAWNKAKAEVPEVAAA